MPIAFTLNGRAVVARSTPDTPLLWVLRDEFSLPGTKFGCGIARCGACTVHVDDVAQRACSVPLQAVEGRAVTTIEGLGAHPLIAAWETEQVPQCGYCQSGQIMQAADLLSRVSNPNDEQIVAAMNGNLCRCMAYIRIRRAIKRAAQGEHDGDRNDA